MDWQSRMLLAIRILSAAAHHREPDPEDATRLRELAESDEERRMPLDELACAVILRERLQAHAVDASRTSGD